MNAYLRTKKGIEYSQLEEWFTIGTLILLSGNFLLPSIIFSLFRYSMLLYVLVYLYANRQKSLAVAMRDPFILALVAIATASVFWSVYPAATLQSIRAELIPASAFGLYIAVRFKLQKQLDLITKALIILILVSIAYTVIFPSVGFHNDDAHGVVWRGVFGHKNGASAYMCVAFCILGFQLIIVQNRSYIIKIAYIAALALIIATTSKSGLAIAAIIFSITLVHKFLPKNSIKGTIFLDFCALVLFWFISYLVENVETVLASQDRSLSLTGRVPIWTRVFDAFQERPLFGYGFDAFWSPGSEYAVRASMSDNQSPFVEINVFSNSHNGFVDLGIDLGGVCLVLLIASFVFSLISALKAALFSKSYGWCFLLLVFIATNNMVESILFGRLNFFWPLYISIALSISSKSFSHDVIKTTRVV